MVQTKVSITKPQTRFLQSHKVYGYKDRSAMVRAALDLFHQQLEEQLLAESAELIAEIYDDDQEAQEWVEGAIEGWPE